MGAINFLVQLDPEMIQAYRESEQMIIQNRPLWATFGFAVAVFGGTTGSLLLLLKRSLSFYFFVASFAGVLVTIPHALGLDIAFGAGEIIGIILMPIVFAAFLIWYSRFASAKNWFRENTANDSTTP